MNNQLNESIQPIIKILEKRHSQYVLSPEWVAPQAEVEALLAETLRLVPSAFNSQPVRIVLLTGEKHQQHWQLIEDALIGIMGQAAYDKQTAAKINGSFRSGVATILFFDDSSVTKGLQEQFPSYAPNFPIWAQQVQGSHQLMVWLGLTEMGFGCNLQHYIGMVDEQIQALAGVPREWTLVAQMPFGLVPAGSEAGDKDKLPTSETLKVL